jgi:putative membrane protein
MTPAPYGYCGQCWEQTPQGRVSREMVTMMFWYGSHLMFWQAALMWIAMIAFWGLVIWAIYAMVTTSTRKPGSEHRGSDARRILDERLARGEIDAAEYQRLRDLIAGGDRQAQADAGSPR